MRLSVIRKVALCIAGGVLFYWGAVATVCEDRAGSCGQEGPCAMVDTVCGTRFTLLFK